MLASAERIEGGLILPKIYSIYDHIIGAICVYAPSTRSTSTYGLIAQAPPALMNMITDDTCYGVNVSALSCRNILEPTVSAAVSNVSD